MKNLSFVFLLFPIITYSQVIFETKSDYIKETVKRTNFDKNKILVENFLDKEGFIEDVFQNHLNVFYGIVYKGEVFSATNLENSSCWGQFAEMMRNLNATNNRKVGEVEYLKELSFTVNKKTVVFIYSSILSKGNIKTNIKPILAEIKKDDSYDYIVLSIDYDKIRMH